MASNNKVVGITVAIEGQNSGLTKSLNEINKDLGATSSALKDVNQALKLDPTNVELLAQKQELLNKQVDQTNERLEILKQVAADAAKGLEDGTVSREQYASLAAEISKTESSLSDLESTAADTAAQMDAIESGEIDEISDDADDAAGSLEDVADEADNSGKALETMGKIGAAALGGAAAAAGALGGAVKEVGGALVDATVSAGDYADEIHTLEQKTGITAERLQEMNYVSGLIDVSTETMTGSMTKLEKSMGSAADKIFALETTQAELNRALNDGEISADEYEQKMSEAAEKNATAYDQLGISIYDANHNLRDSEEVFWEVIDALGQMDDGTERDLLAMELLGKSAKELNPLIEAGSETFNQLAQEAHDAGFVMDGETLDAFQNFDDQMERLSKGGQAAKNALGTILLPSLTDLSSAGTSALNKFTKAVQESNGDVSVIGSAISELLPEVFAEINKMLPDLLSLVGTAVDTLLQILIDNLPLFVDTAVSIIEQLTSTLINPENIGKIMDAAVTIVLSLTEFILQNIDQVINSAIQIILAIVNGISRALPELIPAAVDAILTICETLLSPENLALILDAALQLVIGLAMGIVDSLPEIISRLPEIISGIIEFLLSDDGIGQIISAGFTLFTGLVTKMPEIIVELIGSLGTLLTDLVDYISGDMFDDITGAFGDIFGDIIDSAFGWGADIIDGIMDGIESMWDGFTGVLEDAAGAIGDFLGFSVPEKGPLHEWAYNNPGADMVKLWSEGVESALPELETELNTMANIIADGSGQDYSDQLNGISGTLSTIAAGDHQTVIPVYIGQDRIETIIAKANVNNTFMTGGR